MEGEDFEELLKIFCKVFEQKSLLYKFQASCEPIEDSKCPDTIKKNPHKVNSKKSQENIIQKITLLIIVSLKRQLVSLSFYFG